jgi:hypothetical protein
MQGFNYTQLFSAMQVWPLKASAQYLASINRLIFLGELRLVRDMDLEIFDVNDQVAATLGQTVLPKPNGSQPITFTAPVAQNAVSATLTADFTGVTGVYVVTFSDNEIQAVTLTNNATSATWPLPMANAATTAATINPLFVAERNLWSIYNGVPKLMVKRSWEFIQNYQAAAPGKPYYFADQGTSQWITAPAADANTSFFVRRYIQRPQSIVVAQNTYFGDNLGDVLFTCCLMEAEQWLKADDRYADLSKKYYEELLPNARGEISIAARAGMYTPLQPVASVPQPAAPQQPAQG